MLKTYSPDQITGDTKPGSIIQHRWLGGEGIVVGSIGSRITVLWSKSPLELDFDFSKVTFPTINTTKHPSVHVMQGFVEVQPMTGPAGHIFYQEYKYGVEDKDEE